MSVGSRGARVQPAEYQRDIASVDEVLPETAGPKTRAECEEICLPSLGVSTIHGFETDEGVPRFTQLRSVFLSRNRLSSLQCLRSCTRLQRLHASHNQISRLGDLCRLRYLEEIDISHNMLDDLSHVLFVLSHFQYLSFLDLSGNPCTGVPDYRLHVICNCPSVQVLDLHTVTDHERRNASFLSTRATNDVSLHQSTAFGRRKPEPISGQPPPVTVIPDYPFRRQSQHESEQERMSDRSETMKRPPPPPESVLPRPYRHSWSNSARQYVKQSNELGQHSTTSKKKCKKDKVVLQRFQQEGSSQRSVSRRISDSTRKVRFSTEAPKRDTMSIGHVEFDIT